MDTHDNGPQLAFENGCSVAGFSNVENMLRLQKCLKGIAYDLVLDKLLLPTMVAEVIRTLKTFFGHPDQILDRLIEKAKRISAKKDRLDLLIDYALAVRNTCATMEACQLDAHLNNPMLVCELVDKRPNQYKLNWAMHPKDDP